MMLLVSYLLKVIACSGILFLYYQLALRNKLFHQWNRFYLLSALVLSLVLPVVQITITHRLEEQQNALQLLQVVESANHYLDEVTISSPQSFTPALELALGYALVSAVLLLSLVLSIARIFSLARKYGSRLVMNIRFINTDVAGTPFSFFRYIFWNKNIDLQTENGQRIFEHELVHVKEKHSVDKLVMEAVIILFWCNPFFWLLRRELKMIHEFIADQKAVGQHGAAAFAAMVLQASYSKQFHSITNQFFQTSIKRRLHMITRIQNPKLSYFSRIVALPIIALVALAFTLRSKAVGLLPLERPFTVVIDAGHGRMPNGGFNGAQYKDAVEDELNLSIAKKIQELNPNQQVKIILTRQGRDNIDLRQRVSVAQEAKADLFISIHLEAVAPGMLKDPSFAAREDEFTGMDIYVSNKGTAYQTESEWFGSVLEKQLEGVYKINSQLQRRQVGIWVLDHNVCPSVLLECGYLTNDNDRRFISREANQKLVAERVLSAIQQYAKAKESGSLPAAPAALPGDTTPKQYYKGKEVISVNVNKQRGMIYLTTSDGKIDSLSGEQARKYNFNTPPPLYLVDGREFNGDVNTIDPNTISSMNVLKGETATRKYGDKGKNGVVEIKLKAKETSTGAAPKQQDKVVDKVVVKETNPAAHALYIVDGKEMPDALETVRPGDIQSINVIKGDAGTRKYGDKGKNGVIEITTKKAGVPVNVERSPNAPENHPPAESTIVFDKAETPASVDKGEWRKFLEENLQPVIVAVAQRGAPAGTYTAYVKFIVETDGSLSNPVLVQDPGYGVGQKILELIYKSPRWEPATQNGVKVRSYHTQPITLVISSQ